jgi:hypothetical protein
MDFQPTLVIVAIIASMLAFLGMLVRVLLVLSIALSMLFLATIHAPPELITVNVWSGLECSSANYMGKPMQLNPNECVDGVQVVLVNSPSNITKGGDIGCRSLDIQTWHDSECSTAITLLWHFDSCGYRMKRDPLGLCMVGFQHIVQLNHTTAPFAAMAVVNRRWMVRDPQGMGIWV